MRSTRLATLVLALALVAGQGVARPPSASEQALATGDLASAGQLARQELQANPNDAAALAVLAALDLARNDPGSARHHASRSFAAGKSGHDRFVAARLAAKSAHLNGQSLVAQYWLRRAVQAAPHTQAEQVAIADFKALRRVSPLHLSFDAAFRPSANVNNGAEDPMLSIDGIPTNFIFNEASRALPGAETRLGLGLRYRLSGTERTGTELGLQWTQSTVFLTDRARRIAPMARGSDFSSATVDLQLSRFAELSERSFLRGGLQVGQSWLAGKAYARRAKLDAALTQRLSPVAQTRLGVALERQWRTGAALPSTAVVIDSATERLLASGDVIGLRLTAAKTVSDDANQENHSLSSEVRYALGRSLGGVTFSASMGAALRDFPVFFNGNLNDTGRQDRLVFGSIDLSFSHLKAFGFEPVLSVESRKTRSNVSRFDASALGVGLRIKSSF